ncbi:DNA polymerase subunit beta, partial [Streptomyces sp. DT225]
GVYSRGPPDTAALSALAAAFQGSPGEVAGPGGWGPWVNAGGWLRVDGVQVDWILRDLGRVEAVWAGCREGRYEVGVQ